MIGRLLCRLGWHRESVPKVVSTWGGTKHQGGETVEIKCLRQCGYVIHYSHFPLFTVSLSEEHHQ